MNVFILDKNPILAAQYHCDRHVVKMILEYTQLLSNVCYLKELHYNVVFKPGWLKHPATFWAEKNVQYLISLKTALCNEYTYRYGKVHKYDKTYRVPLEILNIPIKNLTSLNCMPTDCIIGSDNVENYRNYYIKCKRHIAQWKKREVPPWWI